MYDKKKFLRYVRSDMFLKHTWETRKKETPKEYHDAVLEAMFNSYVLENSVALKAYETI